MRINNNIPALNTNSQLTKNNSALDKSLEKLSSGLRINHAADDAAGMAISQKMKTQIRGLEQASRNGADGISVIQTAEGALAEVESMLQRMRELSVQAANGTNTAQDRNAIQLEIEKLNEEIKRISTDTEFNTKTLLNGDIDRKSYSDNNYINLISLSDGVDVNDYQITVTREPQKASVATNNGGVLPNPITANEAGTIIINGQSVEIKVGDTPDVVFQKIRELGELSSVRVTAVTNAAQSTDGTNAETGGYVPTTFDPATPNKLAFVSGDFGSSQKVNVVCENAALAGFLGLPVGGAEGTGVDAQATLKRKTEAEDGYDITATVKTDGDKITVSDRNGFEMKFEVKPGSIAAATNAAAPRPGGGGGTAAATTVSAAVAGGDVATAVAAARTAEAGIRNNAASTQAEKAAAAAVLKRVENAAKVPGANVAALQAAATAEVAAVSTARANVTVLEAGPMELQIGANEGQKMVIRIPEVSPKTLGIDKINISTEAGSQLAITAVSDAVSQVSAIRAKLGAYQNRLEHSIANTDVSSENLTEALSRIEDVNMATEMAKYTQMNVLVQAGTSMLAQANQRPQNVLTLLQG